MAKKQEEPKVILEREYIVPLRRGWLKVPEYKRANKAMKTLKEFIAQHMKIYDRDLRKVKVDNLVNNEIRFRGMKKPLAKIKVKAKKFDDGIVRVELVEVPIHVKFLKLKEEKRKSELEKKKKEKPEVIKPESEKPQETQETKEKETASSDAGLKESEKQSKKLKSVSKQKRPNEQIETIKRRSLSR